MSGDRESRVGFTRVARRWDNVKVVVAEGARAGMRMAVMDRPRIVVVDAELPDAQSLETVNALRKGRSTSSTPVIVLGVDATGDEEARFCQAGADCYLTRPLNVARVDRIVMGLLEVAALR